MTRYKPSYLHPFDLERDRNFHSLRRFNKASTSANISDNSFSVFNHNLLDSHIGFFHHNMDESQITLIELVAPDDTYHALCIEYPELTVPFELKYGLIHLLSKFSGVSGEDPHKHLKES